MILLLIFIYLKTGAIETKTSIVYGDEAMKTCREALPLTKDLYRKGKFHDGPLPILIKDIKGRCEPIEEDNQLASN